MSGERGRGPPGTPGRRVPGGSTPRAAGRPHTEGPQEGPQTSISRRKRRAEGGGRMLSQVMDKLSGGIQFLGGVLIVMGLVNLGMALREGAGGGGGQLAAAISMIVGGGVVVGAAVYFGTLDTSWAG